MFGDYVKMIAKGVALVAGVALIASFLFTFTIPTLNISFVTTYINKAYTIGVHYVPMFSTLWTLGVTLITLDITIYTVRLAMIGVRWVLKVNE